MLDSQAEAATEAAPAVMPDTPATPETSESSDTPRPRLGTRLRRAVRGTPALVWWVTALHLTLLLAYSILLPTYRSPDEPQHVDLAHVFSEEAWYPAWDEANLGAGIHRSLSYVRFGERSQHLTEAEALPRHERPSLEELQDGDPPTSGINQLTQHPPLYYVGTGTAMWAMERVFGDPIGSFGFETWLYRLMSIALVAPLPLVVWRCARLLRLPRSLGVAATLVPLAMPQLLHIGSAVNNDNLVLLTFWLLTPVVIRLAGGQLGPRTAALAGVITGVGLVAKAFALLLPVWVAAALALALYRGGRTALRPVAVAGGVYGATSLVCGGWWWVRNQVLYGKMSPSRFGQMVPEVEGVTLDLGRFVHRWGELTTWRFWGSFGWYDTRLPGALVVVATVVVVVALVLACVRRDRAAATPVGTRLLLLVPLLLVVGNQFYRALNAHMRTGQWPGLQGRYWFGALAALGLLVALGLAHLVRGRYHLVPLGVFVAGVVMHTIAAGVVLGFYWGEPGSAILDRVRAAVAWGPVPGPLVALGAAAGAVVFAVTAVRLTTLAVRPAGAEQAQPAA